MRTSRANKIVMRNFKKIAKLKSLAVALVLSMTLSAGYMTHPTFLPSVLEVMSQRTAYAVSTSQWFPYHNRYAVIVMGGDESGQMYTWYWQDTYGIYQLLITLGFRADTIYFLAYGSDATAHPEAVDRVSTKANVQWAFDQVRMKSTSDDLLYIFWVDHGTNQLFNLHQRTTITHAEYANCIKNISARVIIGAYNPCYSGAVIDNISRMGVVTITSVNAEQSNSAGWAGFWRTALAGGTSSTPSDKNADGYIDMTEAYEWVAPKSQTYRPVAEHSLFDDNGDGVGSEYGTAAYDPNDPNKDGFRGRMYSLTAWRSISNGGLTTTTKTTSNFSTNTPSFFLQLKTPTAALLLSLVVISILLLVMRMRARVSPRKVSSTIKYCMDCGRKLPEDAMLCHSCGSEQIENQS